jgi:hypothetical protein
MCACRIATSGLRCSVARSGRKTKGGSREATGLSGLRWRVRAASASVPGKRNSHRQEPRAVPLAHPVRREHSQATASIARPSTGGPGRQRPRTATCGHGGGVRVDCALQSATSSVPLQVLQQPGRGGAAGNSPVLPPPPLIDSFPSPSSPSPSSPTASLPSSASRAWSARMRRRRRVRATSRSARRARARSFVAFASRHSCSFMALADCRRPSVA